MKPFLLISALSAIFPLCGIETGPEGAWSKDGISAKWLIATPGWQRYYGTTPKDVKRLNATMGEMCSDGKKIRFQTISKKLPDGKIDFHSTLSSAEFPAIGHISYELNIPFDKIRKMVIDGKPLPFPQSFVKPAVGSFPWKTHSLIIEMTDVTYTLNGNFSLFIQDNRKWVDSLSIRLNGRNDLHSGSIGIALNIQRTPVLSETISLTQAANRNFRDEKAGDGAGGWTDQGPHNDLRKLKSGKLTYTGINFEVIDPNKNRGKSCIVLSASQKNFSPEATVSVTGKREFPYLYLLHAAAWVPQPGTRIGSVKISYKEGHDSEFPVISGRDCGNWWIEKSFKNAGIAWEAMNFESRIGLYASAFPLAGIPEKITFSVEGNAMWMICAASFANRGAQFNTTDQKLVIKAGKEWLPVPNPRWIEPGSPLDFSGALYAPAGKFGRVIVNEKGYFVFEKNRSSESVFCESISVRQRITSIIKRRKHWRSILPAQDTIPSVSTILKTIFWIKTPPIP